jgi:MYXO-CTERM domain-containing protein
MKDVTGAMDMTPEAIGAAVAGAASAWSAGENACTYLELRTYASTAATPTARYDYKNSLIFRTLSWCRTAASAGTCSNDYDAAALAITSVFVNTKDGRIRDADIEVNAKNFIWTDLDLNPTAHDGQDLQNALTHEMGHLIGLDHTCFQPGTPGEPPLDNTGTPVPNCDSASPEVRATTMFASAIPGDLQKRTLAPDDLQAVCEIYPKAADPMIYPNPGEAPPTGCACATASPRDARGGLPLAGALVVMALGGRRRKRRD